MKTSFGGYQKHCASLENNPGHLELLEPDLRSDGHCTTLNLGTEEEGLEKEDQNEDSSGIDDQIFHPGEDIIERYDKNQKEKLDNQDTNEPFQNHDQIQAEQKMNGRTGLEDLRIEFDKGKLASCADAYLRKETDKERNMNWSEEYGLKKIMLLNYTERGK